MKKTLQLLSGKRNCVKKDYILISMNVKNLKVKNYHKSTHSRS